MGISTQPVQNKPCWNLKNGGDPLEKGRLWRLKKFSFSGSYVKFAGGWVYLSLTWFLSNYPSTRSAWDVTVSFPRWVLGRLCGVSPFRWLVDWWKKNGKVSQPNVFLEIPKSGRNSSKIINYKDWLLRFLVSIDEHLGWSVSNTKWWKE